MTHDELLDLTMSDAMLAIRKALRAVVELHKPQDITLPNGEWGTNCLTCDGWEYPCQTIQDIEKELK